MDTPHDHPRRFFLANLSVGLGTLLCRITGFGRVLALAYAIGLGGLSDVYNTANTTPNIIYELMLGGILSATLLPTFVRALKDKDYPAISAVMSVACLALAVLTCIMILAAPAIMDLYSLSRKDSPQEFHDVGVVLVRLFMPQIFFYGLISLATALLNAQHKFSLPAYAPILNNLVVCGLLMLLPHLFGPSITLEDASKNANLVFYLGVGTTLGIALSALVLVPALLKSGIALSFTPDWRHPAVRNVLRLSGWTVGYVMANQAALFLVSLIALHREGWLTAYQTAFTFFILPHGLLAMTITTTFLPRITQDATSGDMQGMIRQISHGIRLLILLMLPASVGYMMIARPLLVTLLNHGQFTLDAAHLTADTLSFFAIGLLPFSLYLFLLRGFYALSDTKTPFQINVVENILNIILALPLALLFGAKGLALAYSLAYSGAVVLTFYKLSRRTGYAEGLRWGDLSPYISRICISVAIMAVAVAITLIILSGQSSVWQLSAAVLVGGFTYASAVLSLKAITIQDIRSLISSRT